MLVVKVETEAWVSNWPHLFVRHLFVGTGSRIQRDKSMDMDRELLTTPNFGYSYIFFYPLVLWNMCTATLYLRIKVTGYKIEHVKVKVRLRFIIFASEPWILALNFLLEHIDCQDIHCWYSWKCLLHEKEEKNGQKSASGTRSLSRSFRGSTCC